MKTVHIVVQPRRYIAAAARPVIIVLAPNAVDTAVLVVGDMATHVVGGKNIRSSVCVRQPAHGKVDLAVGWHLQVAIGNETSINTSHSVQGIGEGIIIGGLGHVEHHAIPTILMIEIATHSG